MTTEFDWFQMGFFFFFLTFFPQDKITEKTEQDWPSYGNPNSDLKAHI